MRQEQQKKFISYDGTEIFYRHWQSTEPTENKQAIILFHRGHEHSGRIKHLVDELGLADFQFFAWDARGNGQSDGVRGDAVNFAALVRDAHSFIEHIKNTYSLAEQDIAIVGQSVGAVIASTLVHDYVPKIRALVLASPAFRIKLYIPFAIPGLSLLYNFAGNFFINSYVRPRLLTHDLARAQSYSSDPLITKPISVRLLLDLFATSKRIVKDAQAIQTPTQVLVSGSDYVVRRKPQKQFFDNLGATNKEYHVLSGFYHDTLGEKDRDIALKHIKRFIVACFATEPKTTSLLHADKSGYTCAESDALASPLSNIFKKIYWKSTKASLKYASKLSDGIKLGFDTGFDSGSTLDYVYRNQSSGATGFGCFLDFKYLQSIGWRGIRQRKVHIEELLKWAIASQQKTQNSVNIVDIAAGHGRYILDTISQLKHQPDSVLLRDYDQNNVNQGLALIDAKGLSNIVRFEKGDAFNRQELSSLDIKPTLAVVSGLYELFSDNEMVTNSLLGLADIMEEGSYLIYTGQPWHPQLEFIARALTSHREGQAWVMRRRTQLEMDQLVEQAGFRKIDMRIDEWGIFTVSIAKRVK
ncbi:bifunctional alpha/beta hydrolase/class I SAM-dependent methyltransferase [Orbus wheelerorum]|uniref:bifunctional alpha/beta hydrolase/class I SAM-dependent methyltransferase n=1 Tax=Orbus wheelerorum TaxID=3074111 RepID=UPI00370D81F6